MATYTIWHRGRNLGSTTFDLPSTGRERIGVFHPTDVGVAVLPGITAMVPALFGFKELCEHAGLDTTDDSPAAGAAALERFRDSSEARGIAAAMREIVDLELHDSDGNLLPWQKILIHDANDILAIGERLKERGIAPAHVPDADVDGPIRYIISVTLRDAFAARFGFVRRAAKILS